MANPPSLLSDQSQAAGDQGGIWGGITGLLGLFKPDYSAEYTGSLAKDPTTGQMDPAVQRAFAMRSLAGASQAFAEGGMPVPYKGGIPLLSTIGKAGAAATLAPDSLIDAREKAAQTTLALANAGNAQAMALARQGFAQGYQQRPTGGQSGTGPDGKALTGPAAVLASQGSPPIGAGTGGGTNREIDTNNFAGMRMPGVPAAGGPKTNPAGWQTFDTPAAGVQAIGNQLDRYVAGKTTGQPLTTLRQMVSTWAPPSENDTGALIARASAVTGLDPDAPVNMADPAIRAKVTEAFIRNEQGGNLHPKAAEGLSAVYGDAWSPYGGKATQTASAPAPPVTGQPAGPAPAPGKPPSLLDLPQVPNASQQLAPVAPPNAPALPAPPAGSPPPSQQGAVAPPMLGPGAGGVMPVATGGAAPDMQPMPGRFGGMGPMRGAPPGLLQVSDTGGGPGPNLVPGGAMTGPPPQVTQGPPADPSGGLLANPPAAPPPPPAGAAPAPAPPPPAAPAPAAPQAAPPAAPVAPAAAPPPPTIPPELNKHISDAEIQWAKKMSALAIAGGLTVPPDIAALSTLDVDMAKAEQQARLKAYYDLQTAGPIAAATAAGKLPYTPERVAPGAGISMGGQPPAWYAPEHVEMFNPATQRKEWATGTKQPDGTTKYEFSGIPTGPSAAETSAGTTAGPYTPAAVPGAPMRAAPGAPPIYPQNPNPAKNIQSPSGTVIPAPTNQVLPQNYSDYAKQQDLWNERRSDLVTAQTLSAGAETKIRMMIDAAKVNQMGAGTEGRAQLGNWLVTLGANQDWVNKNLTNVPAVQQFLYGQARETLGTLAAVNKRFTGGEFKITSQSGAGTEYLNEANLPVLADDLARVRQLQLVSQDFNHAQTVKYADGSYWNNPESFIAKWYEANPLGKIKAQTMQQIGPLAGMTGVPGVPKEAVPTGRTSGGWPVYKMPNGQEGTFPGEWR